MKNCVSQSITNLMVQEVARLFDTEWATAITGYTTAVPESGFELYTFCAVFYKDKIILSKK